ncbi:hypothetical protein Tco_0947946 [Tanacetum coccineum]
MMSRVVTWCGGVASGGGDSDGGEVRGGDEMAAVERQPWRWPEKWSENASVADLVKLYGCGVEFELQKQWDQFGDGGSDKKARCSLMDGENPTRERVKKISEKSRKVLGNGGSSLVTLRKFVEDLL